MPIIAKGIAAFYALKVAIGVSTVAMAALNAAMNINLGPAKKAAGFFAKDMPSAMGKSVGAAGKLQSAFGVLAAAGSLLFARRSGFSRE